MQRTSKRKPIFTFVAIAVAAIAIGCGEAPENDEMSSTLPEVAESSDSVKLYYTKTVDGTSIVQEETITRAQADEIFRARAEHRATHEKTVGSTNWAAACQFWDWTLVTSGPNQTGNIFCAKDDGTNNLPMIPFVPAFISFSNTSDTKLCTGFSGCTSTCTSVGPAVWGRWHPRSDMNISPPSNVRFLDVTPMQFC